MEQNIENLIEELTKVRPEVLNEEALKLFNTIMAILDERDKLKKENKELKEITKQYDAFTNDYMENDKPMIIADRRYFACGIFKENFIPKSKIKEKIEEQYKLFNTPNRQKEYSQEVVDVLQELMEDK